MNYAKRAIILAAGIGHRLRPVSSKTPKPLVKVNEVPMIETIIRALHNNDIYEIYIVSGYLKEQFLYLKDKYKSITLLENDQFHTSNNISSLYVAKDYLEDVIILDGDQIILNENILSPAFEKSCYCGAFTKNTGEWLLKLNGSIITSCSRTGGKDGYRLYSISFWSKEDGEKLKKHVYEQFIDKNNNSIYWDDLPFFYYPEEYHLGLREISEIDVIEIDTVEELIQIDNSYANIKPVQSHPNTN